MCAVSTSQKHAYERIRDDTRFGMAVKELQMITRKTQKNSIEHRTFVKRFLGSRKRTEDC